jgi:hypothetical protein
MGSTFSFCESGRLEGLSAAGGLKWMALQTTLGVLAVIPAHGIFMRTRMRPVTRETENLGAIKIVGISGGMFCLGDFVFQTGPPAKIGVLGP